ncbi:MAG: hypothetical protein AB1898_13290 [Acidobacteriota bacterium]
MEVWRRVLRYQALAALVVGSLLGMGVWIFSPWLVGVSEPWDADTPFWTLSWLAIALVGGLMGHLRGVWLPLGYALGQIIVTIPLASRSEFGVLGWLFIGGYALAAGLGTLALVGLVTLLRRLWSRRGG